MRGSELTIKENTETLVGVSKEIGLEVSADKTKYIVMSRDTDVERSHSVISDNSTFESVEQFRCLAATLTDQNIIQEEIKEQIELRKCLLSFGAEYFVFQCG